MKIALFGGTFDPIHDGHIAVAETVLKKLKLDQVWFIPAGNPPLKNKCMFSFDQRINMIKEKINYNPAFSTYVNDIRDEDKSYTIYLINDIKKTYPDDFFYFVIGADNVTKLKHWYKFDILIDLIDFVVLDRETPDKNEWNKLDYYNKLIFVDMPIINISSTEIRKNLYGTH